MGIPLEKKIEQIEALKEVVGGSGDGSRLLELLVRFCIESQNDYTDTERETFGDILVRFLPTVDNAKRRDVSEQFAPLARAPAKIARFLALDVIEVARPILVHSPVLSEEDLLVVSRIRGHEHMLAICERQDISFPVAAELVKFGHEDVWVRLLENIEAKISYKTFQVLRKHALKSYPVLYGLLDRQDISEQIMRKVVLEAGESIRDHLRQKSYHELISYLDEASEVPKKGNAPLEKLRLLSKSLHTSGEMKSFREPDFLATLLDDDIDKIICMFSYMTGLSLPECMNLLGGRDLDPVMLACKAVRLRTSTVECLLKTGSWKITLAEKRRKQLLDGYDKLNPKVAHSILKMRVKASKQKAVG